MEEHSNGEVEETQKEETHRNGVETVKELFEEVKAELLHGKDSSSESSSSDEEEEKTEPVEEVLLETVPEPVEDVSPDMTPEVETPIDEGSNVVAELEAEEAKEKATELESEDVEEEAIELESEDVEEKEGIEQIALPSEEAEAPPPPSDGNMGETSEVADKKESEDSADVPCVDSGNKAEISTETTTTSPIISISNRTVQPTSWRSCCGLFEVLRRNK